MSIERRVLALEHVASAPDRLAEDCRQRARSIVDGINALHAVDDGYTVEQSVFVPLDVLERVPQLMSDAEQITLHDRMRATFDLPPVGVLP